MFHRPIKKDLIAKGHINSTMNSLPARRAAVLVGLGIVGFFAADKVLGSKNNNVTWDINRQLDQMNEVADMGRQAS